MVRRNYCLKILLSASIPLFRQIYALPEVVEAVDDRVEVYMDGWHS